MGGGAISPTELNSLVAAGAGFAASLTEAITAINGTVSTGPEGDHGFCATFGANSRVHLTSFTAAATPATKSVVRSLAVSLPSAIWASLGLIAVALFRTI